MQHIMKLKTLLLYRNKYLYISISLLIFILIYNSFWYVILLAIFSIYIIKMHKDLIKIIILVLIIYIVSLTIFNIQKTNPKDTYNITVINNIKVDEYTSFIGRVKTTYILVYFDENLSIKPGDKLTVKGNIESPRKATIPNTFDYSNYLKSQGIKYTIFAREVEYKKSSFSLFMIPYYLEKYIDKSMPLTSSYIKTFILAEKEDISIDVRQEINKTGISHLFAVSGLHIGILVLSIQYLLSKLNMKKNNYENIIIALLLVYLIITSFSPSVSRASIMYILLVMNKRYKLEFSSLDILSIILISLLFIRPYYYYDAGFLLSFLVTFSILISSSILKKESKIHQLFLISSIAFLVTIPVILQLNYQINLLSLLFNIVFLLYVSYLILPLSYIAFFLPFFDRINYVFIHIFEFALSYVSKINFLVFKFYFPNKISIIIYYFLVFIFMISLENKSNYRKRFLYIIILLIIVYISPNLNPVKSVSFIDIYGDSTLITDSYNKCNILIDTGEYDEYNSVIHYLKAKNIKRLDYLIISHFHSDHYGEASDIIQDFIVNTVISKDNVANYEDKLLYCGSISIYIYPFTYKEENENNNSIIMSLFINDKHYLFTGDIELSREVSFKKKYDFEIDYLKVPHHGSITSSNEEFIESLNPKEAFIIVSIKNLHGHPHDQVIKRYKEMGIPVYRTDLNGTIEVYYIFGKEYKRIHSP